MKNLLEKEALEFVGPSFEEMNEDQMMNIDAEITPTVISMSVLKVTCSALTGVAFTFTVDKIFNHK